MSIAKKMQDVLAFLVNSRRTRSEYVSIQEIEQAISMRLLRDMNLDAPLQETLKGMIAEYGLDRGTEFAAEGMGILLKRLQKMLNREWNRSEWPGGMISLLVNLDDQRDSARVAACAAASTVLFRVARSEPRPLAAIRAALAYASNPSASTFSKMLTAGKASYDMALEEGYYNSSLAALAASHCTNEFPYALSTASHVAERAYSDWAGEMRGVEMVEGIAVRPDPLTNGYETVPAEEVDAWLSDRRNARVLMADEIQAVIPYVELRNFF